MLVVVAVVVVVGEHLNPADGPTDWLTHGEVSIAWQKKLHFHWRFYQLFNLPTATKLALNGATVVIRRSASQSIRLIHKHLFVFFFFLI